MEFTYFSIDGNIWILLGVSILLVLFTIYSYYYTIPEISRRNKTILIILRSFSILLTLFLIFNPKLIYSTYKEIQPRLALLLDNSQSMKIKDRSYDRQAIYSKILKNFDYQKFGVPFFHAQALFGFLKRKSKKIRLAGRGFKRWGFKTIQFLILVF